MVIVSFVRTNSMGFLKDVKRLNVAITRAKCLLILIARAGNNFLKEPSYKCLWDFCKSKCAIKTKKHPVMSVEETATNGSSLTYTPRTTSRLRSARGQPLERLEFTDPFDVCWPSGASRNGRVNTANEELQPEGVSTDAVARSNVNADTHLPSPYLYQEPTQLQQTSSNVTTPQLQRQQHQQPVQYYPQSHGYVLQPAQYQLQPIGYVLQPAQYHLQPHGYVLQPQTYQLQPHVYVLQPQK